MNFKYVFLTVSAFVLFAKVNADAKLRETTKENNSRKGKLFSLFQVIQFPNEACNGTGTGSGICYTNQECNNRNGASIGSCANGFGVCCSFTISCGATSSENLTVFTDTNIPTGMGECSARICPSDNNICQLRLDFERFQISGPSTATATVTGILNGQPSISVKAIPNSEVSQCTMDRFQVTSGSGAQVPVICGINTGQHVFVDADSNCNTLSFQFGPMANMRAFQIRVTQYTCNSPNLAPTGCTQYFTSASGSGIVQTFNFGNGHLANQNQVMCVRQNQNACRICWTAAINTDFDVSGTFSAGLGSTTTLVTSCCGPNQSMGKEFNKQGLDCLSLPLAENFAGTKGVRSRFCGRNSGLSSGGPITVCSRTSPFRVAFRSDAFEVSDPAFPLSEAMNKDNGVKLIYFQDSVNCVN